MFSALLLVPFTYYNYLHYMKNYKNTPKGYDYPVLLDFKDCIVLSATLQFLLTVVGNISYYIFVPCSKGKGDPKEIEMRCTKAGNTFAKCCYMCVSTTFGYLIMKDADFYPSYLGGHGDYSLLFKN